MWGQGRSRDSYSLRHTQTWGGRRGDWVLAKRVSIGVTVEQEIVEIDACFNCQPGYFNLPCLNWVNSFLPNPKNQITAQLQRVRNQINYPDSRLVDKMAQVRHKVLSR